MRIFSSTRATRRSGYARLDRGRSRARAQGFRRRTRTRSGRVERVKAMSRKAGAAADDSYRRNAGRGRAALSAPAEAGGDSPQEIRRQEAAVLSARAIVGVAGIATVAVIAGGVRFLFHSPQFALVKPEQIELTGNHFVSRDAVLQQFFAIAATACCRFRSTSAARARRIALGRDRQRAAHSAQSHSRGNYRAHAGRVFCAPAPNSA